MRCPLPLSLVLFSLIKQSFLFIYHIKSEGRVRRISNIFTFHSAVQTNKFLKAQMGYSFFLPLFILCVLSLFLFLSFLSLSPFHMTKSVSLAFLIPAYSLRSFILSLLHSLYSLLSLVSLPVSQISIFSSFVALGRESSRLIFVFPYQIITNDRFIDRSLSIFFFLDKFYTILLDF